MKSKCLTLCLMANRKLYKSCGRSARLQWPVHDQCRQWNWSVRINTFSHVLTLEHSSKMLSKFLSYTIQVGTDISVWNVITSAMVRRTFWCDFTYNENISILISSAMNVARPSSKWAYSIQFYSLCHTKERIGKASPANPLFGMTMTIEMYFIVFTDCIL